MSEKTPRQTRQKTLIIETIRQENVPLTADQILTRARLALPGLALTTVYRNLEILTQQQTISRLIYPDGITRYQLATDLHHHDLVCLTCGRSVEISQCPLECLTRQIESETGYQIVSHHLTLYGYCESCLLKESKGSQSDPLDAFHSTFKKLAAASFLMPLQYASGSINS